MASRWLAISMLLLGLTMQAAAAQTIHVFSNSGATDTLPSSIPFTLLDLGTGTPNTKVQGTTVTGSSSPVKLPSGSEISQIAFGTTNVSGSTPSAVFAGGVSGYAASPFGITNTTTNYLTAGGSGGTVTVSYSVTQNAVELLWGSVDSGTTNNVLTFKNNGTTVATVNGSQIAAAVGSGFVTGVTNVAVRISGLAGYNTLVLSDGNGAAFEFALVKPVPEPATIAILGCGLAGLRLVRRRAKARR